MSSRGLSAYIIATAVYAAVVWAICLIGDNWLDIAAIGGLAIATWSCLRLSTISIRRVRWLLSLGCAIAFYLEVAAIVNYADFAYPEEFHSTLDLRFFQTIAIAAFFFGRVLDFNIMKPYFPRKLTEEIAE